MKTDRILRAKAGTTLRSCVARILRTYARANEAQRAAGSGWYQAARDVVVEVSVVAGIDTERSAIVVAHLSPRTRWARNTAGALALASGLEPAGCLKANVRRARAALVADDPWLTFGARAPKTRAFTANLLGDVDAVTIDVWAARIALGRVPDLETTLSRAGVYEALATAYRRAAAKLGETPATTQATSWIVARNGRVG